MSSAEVSAPSSAVILGGTFDPPHLGHLLAIQQVREQLQADVGILVPAGQQWQKEPANATPEQRLEMVRMAIRDDPHLRSSDVDIQRKGPTYTIDTFHELSAQYPETSLAFVLGSDALPGLHTWHRAKELVDSCRMVVVTRPAHQLAIPTWLHNRVEVVEIAGYEISSTWCRSRVRQGLSLRYAVPSEVRLYIAQHGLYR